MFLVVLGIIALIFAFASRQNSKITQYASVIRTVGLLFIAFGVLTSCVKQIGAGEIGVQTLFGKIQDTPLYSGLSFVNPMVEITYFDIKTQNYTMSQVHDEGSKIGDDAIRILTSDGLEVVIDLTVLFRILPEETPRIMRETGSDYVDKIVRPLTRTRIRDNAVFYNAIELYSTKREEFQQRIFKTIEADFKSRGMFLEQLLIRNIDLPASVKTTIESKINAEQESQKMEFVLAKEKQEAERKRVEAQGISDYQKIISQSLTEAQLRYEMIKAQKEIALSPNTKVIITDGKTPVIMGGN